MRAAATKIYKRDKSPLFYLHFKRAISRETSIPGPFFLRSAYSRLYIATALLRRRYSSLTVRFRLCCADFLECCLQLVRNVTAGCVCGEVA